MRKMMTAILALATVASLTPSPAATKLTYEAAAYPCAALCHYWLFGSGVGGTGLNTAEEEGCGAVGLPEGIGYHQKKFRFDSVLKPGPGGALVKTAELTISMFPQVDWDFWVCTDTPGISLEVIAGANNVQAPCDNPLGAGSPVPYGCYEVWTLTLDALYSVNSEFNDNFIIRAFNWSDPSPTIPVIVESQIGGFTAL